MSYTLPLSEAETQLRDLVKRTRATHSPVLLTSEETAKPVAVVLEIDAYEQIQRYQQRYYHLQLTQMKQWLDRADKHLDDPTVRDECVRCWQEGITSLWEVAPKTAKEFCATLVLAVKHLDAHRLSTEQLAALRYSLELLRDSDPDELVQEKARQMLIESGIPPLISFDDDTLVQSYLEEL